MRGFGCRIQWDVNLARSLYVANVPLGEIMVRVGAGSERAIKAAAYRYRWGSRRRVGRIANPKMVTKRCPGCLALYRALPDTDARHCHKPALSIYGVAA